jgi:hypothetical protein
MPQSKTAVELASGRSSTVNHGRLTQKLLSGANWLGADGFPGAQVWADDVEQVLTFLQQESRLSVFLSLIQKAKNPQHRDAQLAEARAAFHLTRVGFRILGWEPAGEGGNKGEMLVSLDDSPAVFVEVKQPSWRAERVPRNRELNRLSPKEKKLLFDRVRQDKFLPGICEGRSVAPQETTMDVVRRNALYKLTDSCPNLAVVVDDCVISAVCFPGLAEYLEREFLNPNHDPDDPDDIYTYKRLGAVLFLRPEAENAESIEYKIDFVENPFVLPECALPSKVSALFVKLRDETKEREVKRYARVPSFLSIMEGNWAKPDNPSV